MYKKLDIRSSRRIKGLKNKESYLPGKRKRTNGNDKTLEIKKNKN